MSIDNIIRELKGEIKKLCKQHSDTPVNNTDSELLLGVISVHKAELSQLEEQKKQEEINRRACELLEEKFFV